MKRALRLVALVLLASGIGLWLARGSNRGWTKTSVAVKSMDEVTGIEGIAYEKRFVPGIDFLGAATLGAGILAAASLMIRRKPQNTRHCMNQKPLIALLSLVCLTGATFAGPKNFDFKDPKGVNNAVFKLDAPLEAINGSANGISGSVAFDPEHPAATHGKIVVASASLHVGNPMMKEHLHSDKWLDVAKYPEITFVTKGLKNVKTSDNTTTADATGTLTIKGISKELTVPVKLTYLKDKLGQRVPNLKGDLLVIRANFQIQRGDFGLMPGQMEEKVSNTIDLTLSIAGASPQ